MQCSVGNLVPITDDLMFPLWKVRMGNRALSTTLTCINITDGWWKTYLLIDTSASFLSLTFIYLSLSCIVPPFVLLVYSTAAIPSDVEYLWKPYCSSRYSHIWMINVFLAWQLWFKCATVECWWCNDLLWRSWWLKLWLRLKSWSLKTLLRCACNR